jgi:hypothetical protein
MSRTGDFCHRHTGGVPAGAILTRAILIRASLAGAVDAGGRAQSFVAISTLLCNAVSR